MAAGEYLPPVVTRLSMDLGDFAAKIAEAKAMMKTLGDDIEATFKVRSSGITATANRIAALRAQMQGLNAEVKVTADGLAAVAAKVAAAGAVGGAAGGAAGGGFRAFGWLTPTAIHWIISGGAEILAVVVPAMVALGAGMAVAAQGAQMVQQHMEAVYTATEATQKMFGVTAGMAIGMGHALQSAQDAANPSVYAILGSGIITVNEHFGNLAHTGLQVVQMFQTFAAKVAVEFGPGGSLGNATNELLSHMTSDLQGIGQLFGNLGHGLLSFASQMPGLAEILLGTFAGLAAAISNLIQLADRFRIFGLSILTVFMAFEEFQRWGGLVVNLLAKMGLGVDAVTGKWYTLEHLGGVFQGLLSVLPGVIGLFGKLFTTLGATAIGGKITGFSEAIQASIKELSWWQAGLVLAAAAGLGFLIYKAVTARSEIQQMTDSMQKSVLGASNLQAQGVALNNIGSLNQQLATMKANTVSGSQAATRFAGNVHEMAVSAAIVNTRNTQMNAGLQQQEQDLVNVSQGAAYLANTYHTNLVGALALADMANVKLAGGIMGTSQAADVNRMKVASLVQGYLAMGQPLGAVGSDMTALAIQSGLASTKVSQLNQAWDQFQQNLTGGTAGLGGFVQSIANMGSKVATGGNNLKAAGSITLGVQQFAQSLTSFSGQGAQAWQNFDQVVGSTAPQLIDWLRTAGAEGALSGPQFTKAVLGMTSSLVGFASKSPTAQTELLGLVHQVDPNIKTWGQLTQTLKGTHASLGDTQSAIESATAKMGDMAQIAQNLGNVLQTALLTALSQAKIQASGAGQAMQIYEQDIMNAGTSAQKTAGDRAALIQDLEKLGYSAKQAAQLIGMVAQNLNGLHSKTVTVTTVMQTVGAPGITTGIPLGVRAAKGYASGTSGASSGWAWVGEAGPELVRFRGGETVIPNQVARGYAGGTDFGPQPVNVYLDGRQIYSAMQGRAVDTQRRTGHNGMSKRTR